MSYYADGQGVTPLLDLDSPLVPPGAAGVIARLGTLRTACAVVQIAIRNDDLDRHIATEFLAVVKAVAVAVIDQLEPDDPPPDHSAAPAPLDSTTPEETPCVSEGSPHPPLRWKPVRDASAPDWPLTERTSAPTVEASDKSSSDSCPSCDGSGVMRWQQPTRDAETGQTVLRDMEHPCPLGCGSRWKHPARENHLVVDDASDRPQRVLGHAAAAGKLTPEFGELLADIYDRYSKPEE